jgi:hypothetical protein
MENIICCCGSCKFHRGDGQTKDGKCIKDIVIIDTCGNCDSYEYDEEKK